MSVRATPLPIVFASSNVLLSDSAFTPQQRPKWCWAACASMLRDLLQKPPKHQCVIAGETLGLVCCGVTHTSGCISSVAIPEGACDRTRSDDEIDEVLNDQDISFTPSTGSLSESALDAQVVTEGRPVQIYKERLIPIANHVVLVLSKEGDKYEVADPCETGPIKMTYDELLEYRGAWKKTWIDLE
jgi:hypothetical protein